MEPILKFILKVISLIIIYMLKGCAFIILAIAVSLKAFVGLLIWNMYFCKEFNEFFRNDESGPVSKLFEDKKKNTPQ